MKLQLDQVLEAVLLGSVEVKSGIVKKDFEGDLVLEMIPESTQIKDWNDLVNHWEL